MDAPMKAKRGNLEGTRGKMEILRWCVLLHTPFSFLIVMTWHAAEDISLLHTMS